jgi:hypothetical protein
MQPAKKSEHFLSWCTVLARLQPLNSSHCGGSHCEPDDCGGFCSP